MSKTHKPKKPPVFLGRVVILRTGSSPARNKAHAGKSGNGEERNAPTRLRLRRILEWGGLAPGEKDACTQCTPLLGILSHFTGHQTYQPEHHKQNPGKTRLLCISPSLLAQAFSWFIWRPWVLISCSQESCDFRSNAAVFASLGPSFTWKWRYKKSMSGNFSGH